jgi:hypothetical protein
MSCKTSTHHNDVTTISESLFICNSKYHLLKRALANDFWFAKSIIFFLIFTAKKMCGKNVPGVCKLEKSDEADVF